MNSASPSVFLREPRATRALSASLLLAIALACVDARTASASPEHITDTAHLHQIASDGDTITERGKATGSLPGTVTITFTLRGSRASSTFNLAASGGTLTGTGSGKVKLGKDGYDSFGGSLHLTHGTGRFAGASGHGGLYGSIYRITQAEPMTVQVTGTLRV